jgi:hypothetical protein
VTAVPTTLQHDRLTAEIMGGTEGVDGRPAAPRPQCRTAAVALAGAAIAGTLAESAVRAGPPGAGLTLAALALLLTLALARGRQHPASPRLAAAYALPVLFALLLAVRASGVLVALNVVALLVALALLAHALAPDRRWPLARARPLTFLLALARTATGAMFGAPRLALEGYAGGGRALPVVAAVLRASLLAAPVLGLFTLLLASADPVFGQGVERLLDVDVSAIAWHSAVAAALAWGAAGYLRTALLPRQPWQLSAPSLPRLTTVDVIVLLGALDALFAAFVVVQLRYLFGGAAVVSATAGLTFADYARRGFFELVVVTALAVPLLLTTHGALARTGAPRRAFRWLAAPMVALLLVVVASALRRMQLYQAEFGLTLARVVASAFIVWVAVVLVLFAATVLRARARWFAWRSLLSGGIALLALNVANPEALVVRTNVQRAAEGRALDVDYLTRLSADAAPALAAALPALGEREACPVRAALARAMRPARASDGHAWQTWSLANYRARALARVVARHGSAGPCAPLPRPTSGDGAGE